jgi:cytochrome c-type biogenesis protein CcmH/NrfG
MTTERESEPLGKVVGAGVVLILIGCSLAGWAVLFDVSAPIEAVDAERLFPPRVANADLMAQRAMIALAAAANYVSGWVMLAGGLALRVLRPPG